MYGDKWHQRVTYNLGCRSQKRKWLMLTEDTEKVSDKKGLLSWVRKEDRGSNNLGKREGE